MEQVTLSCIDGKDMQIYYQFEDNKKIPRDAWTSLILESPKLTAELIMSESNNILRNHLSSGFVKVHYAKENMKEVTKTITSNKKKLMLAMDLGTTTSMLVSAEGTLQPLQSSNVNIAKGTMTEKDAKGEDVVSSYKTDMTIDDDGQYAVDASAIVIDNLTKHERTIEDNEVELIVSAPAYFNQRQRLAIKKAGKQAGVNVKHIVNEPTAAAIKLQSMGILSKDKLLVVLDIGGGTYDISILKHEEDGRFKVLHTDGDKVGGDDIDNQLFLWYKLRTNQPLMSLVKNKTEIMRRLRLAKCELSYAEFGGTNMEDLGLKSFSLSREDLTIIVNSLFKSIFDRADDVISQYAKKYNLGVELAFVGGSTYSPIVRNLEKFITTPHSIVEYDLKRDEVVSLGLQVLLQSDDIKSMLEVIELTDKYRFQLASNEEGCTVIQKGSNIPCKNSIILTNTKGSALRLNVYQGTKPKTLDNAKVGTILIPYGASYEAGDLSISITLQVDNNLLITAEIEIINKNTYDIIYHGNEVCIS